MVGVPEVENYLQQVEDEQDQQKQVKERQQKKLERLSVQHPRFDEVLQLLLPCDSVQELSVVVLTILDKHQKPLGAAKVPMATLLGAPDLHLEGPFKTDVEGVDVVGCLRLKWLDERHH